MKNLNTNKYYRIANIDREDQVLRLQNIADATKTFDIVFGYVIVVPNGRGTNDAEMFWDNLDNWHVGDVVETFNNNFDNNDFPAVTPRTVITKVENFDDTKDVNNVANDDIDVDIEEIVHEARVEYKINWK